MTFETAIDIAAIIFGAGGILTFFVNYKRSNAQNTLDLSTAWEKLSAPLLKRIEQLETRTALQEAEIGHLRGYIERLIRQIIQMGGVPVPFLKDQREPKDI